MLGNPTDAELTLLSNTVDRVENGKRLMFKISNRRFDSDFQLNGFIWNDIEFENCDFVNCVMTRGTIRNARFVNCLFFASTWRDRNWENVSFHGCAWRGPFKMEVGNGKKFIQFEDCEFVGSTQQELGYGGKAEYFGSIGGTNGKVTYRNCIFERILIHSGQSTECRESKMLDVVINAQENSEILFDNIVASGLIDLGNNKFSKVKFAHSTFSERLTFEATTMRSAVFDTVIANLDLTMVEAESVLLTHMTFRGAETSGTQLQYGLNCASLKVKSFRIEHSGFAGIDAELHLSGEEVSEELTIEQPITSKNPYSTDIENLVIRSTPIVNGHFRYMRIGKLVMEDLRITSADFSRTVISLFDATNVTTAEKLELGSVKIRKNNSNIRLGSFD